LRVYCDDRPGATKVKLAGSIKRKRLVNANGSPALERLAPLPLWPAKRACKKNFAITTGTPFASHKLPLKDYLAAITIFCNEEKGKSALALSRDLCISYKACFTSSAMAIEG
jgi:hypothetical protein